MPPPLRLRFQCPKSRTAVQDVVVGDEDRLIALRRFDIPQALVEPEDEAERRECVAAGRAWPDDADGQQSVSQGQTRFRVQNMGENFAVIDKKTLVNAAGHHAFAPDGDRCGQGGGVPLRVLDADLIRGAVRPPAEAEDVPAEGQDRVFDAAGNQKLLHPVGDPALRDRAEIQHGLRVGHRHGVALNAHRFPADVGKRLPKRRIVGAVGLAAEVIEGADAAEGDVEAASAFTAAVQRQRQHLPERGGDGHGTRGVEAVKLAGRIGPGEDKIIFPAQIERLQHRAAVGFAVVGHGHDRVQQEALLGHRSGAVSAAWQIRRKKDRYENN